MVMLKRPTKWSSKPSKVESDMQTSAGNKGQVSQGNKKKPSAGGTVKFSSKKQVS